MKKNQTIKMNCFTFFAALLCCFYLLPSTAKAQNDIVGKTMSALMISDANNQPKAIPFIGEKVLLIQYTDPDVKDINDKTRLSTGEDSETAVIRAIVSLGQNLKLHVLAEGVETIVQRDFLADLGCDLMQGYLFARPVPADDAAAILSGSVAIPNLTLRMALSA